MRVPGTCLLLLVLGGCFGMCPSASTAKWVEPGFFEWLEASAHPVNRQDVEVALEFQPPSTHSSWSGLRLEGVTYQPNGTTVLHLTPRVATRAGWWIEEHGELATQRPRNYSEADLRSEFEAVLANTTALSGAKLEERWHALLASRREQIVQRDRDRTEFAGYGFTLPLAGDLRLDGLVASILGDKGAQLSDPSPRYRSIKAENWSLAFEVPTLMLNAALSGGAFEALVGANDVVKVDVPRSLTRNETGAKEWAAAQMRALGYGSTSFQDWSFSTVVC